MKEDSRTNLANECCRSAAKVNTIDPSVRRFRSIQQSVSRSSPARDVETSIV